MRSILVLVTVSSAIAAAEAPAPPTPPSSPAAFAVAVNPPLRWVVADGVAASGYLGLLTRHALRANVSYYRSAPNLAGEIIGTLLDGASDEVTYRGSVTDVGVGWMYFPHRRWSGVTLEVGVLLRRKDSTVEDFFYYPMGLRTETLTVAGRALVGWSLPVLERGFVSIAAGVSVGGEYGTETGYRDFVTPPTIGSIRNVRRRAVGAEGFLRLGYLLGR